MLIHHFAHVHIIIIIIIIIIEFTHRFSINDESTLHCVLENGWNLQVNKRQNIRNYITLGLLKKKKNKKNKKNKKKEEECQITIFYFSRCELKLRYYGDVIYIIYTRSIENQL